MIRFIAIALAIVAMSAGLDDARAAGAPPAGFVGVEGTAFVLDGQVFRVAGANNHYLAFGSRDEIIRVLDSAKAMGVNVVRTFLQPVVGSLDGKVPTIWNWRSDAESSAMGAKGRHVLYWDAAARKMAFDDGPDGLGRFDFVVNEARKRDIRLIVSFLDFWGYGGGAQQMSAWYGSKDKYTFFASDPRTKRDYQDWVRHVLSRVNTMTGRAYRDEPTIMAWDLMNEPDIHPIPLMIEWVSEMSAFIKNLDQNHLVASGRASMREPFAELDVPTVDFGTWHGYPSYEGMSHTDFEALAVRNCALGKEYGKPILLEEFGVSRTDPDQAQTYHKLLAAMRAEETCPGWVVWRLVARQDSGRFPADSYDGFDVEDDGSPIWEILKGEAHALVAGEKLARESMTR